MVAIIVVVTIVIVRYATSIDRATAGECLSAKGFKGDTAPSSTVNCTDPSALKVAVRLDNGMANCPEGNYVEYSTLTDHPSYALCLIPNVQEGDCVANFRRFDFNFDYHRVACEDPTAEMKVAKIVQGVFDARVCDSLPVPATPVAYSKPRSTYCYTLITHSVGLPGPAFGRHAAA